jgi:hypothetical protein
MDGKLLGVQRWGFDDELRPPVFSPWGLFRLGDAALPGGNGLRGTHSHFHGFKPSSS